MHGPSDRANAAQQPVRSNGKREIPAVGAPATGETGANEYVRKAAAVEDVDLQAVAEARKLLESGELDTPEAAARAAERILSSGI